MTMPLTILSTLAATTAALVSPAVANTAEEAFYRAFYLENALRDLAEAETAYAAAATAAREEKRSDLEVRALVARGRCLERLGRADEAKVAFSEALALDPNSVEAKEAIAATAASASGEVYLTIRLEAGLRTLDDPKATDAARKSAIEEIILLGRRHVPRLEQALRFGGLASASGVAQALARIGTKESLGALANVLRDAEFAFVPPVIEALRHLGQDDAALSVFEVATMVRDPLQRLVAAQSFFGRDFDPALAPRVEAVVMRLAHDVDSVIRRSVYGYRKIPSTGAAVIRTGLAREEEQDRLEATRAAGRSPALAPLVERDLIETLRGDRSNEVRAQAFDSLLNSIHGNKPPHVCGDAARRDALVIALGSGVERLVGDALAHVGASPTLYDLGSEPLRSALLRTLRVSLEMPLDSSRAHWVDRALEAFAPKATTEELLSLYAVAGAEASPLNADQKRAFRNSILSASFDNLGLRDYKVSVAERERRARDFLATAERTITDDVGLSLVLTAVLKLNLPLADVFARHARSESVDVRKVAYEGLLAGNAPRPAGVPLPHLGEDITSGESEFRRHAQSLAEEDPSKVEPDAFRKLLRTGSAEERVDALLALVKSAGDAALPDVREALASDESKLRHAATHILAELRGDEAVPEIIDVARAKRDFWMPTDPIVGLLSRKPAALSPSAVETLARSMFPDKWHSGIVDFLADDVRRKFIVEALSNRTNPFLAQVIETAGRWHVREAWPRLLALTEDSSEKIRSAARTALEQIEQYERLQASFERFGDGGREKAVADARALLASPDAAKRRGAVLALGALGDAGAVPLLLERLEDADPAVREAALGALERLGGKPQQD